MSKRGEEQDDGPKIEMIVDRQVEGLRRWMSWSGTYPPDTTYPIPGRVKPSLPGTIMSSSDAGPGAEEAVSKIERCSHEVKARGYSNRAQAHTSLPGL